MSEEFKFSRWVSEGSQGLRSKFQRKSILPTKFHEHMKSSRKEFLLAFRSLFDIAIDRVDKPKRTIRRKETKIKVD